MSERGNYTRVVSLLDTFVCSRCCPRHTVRCFGLLRPDSVWTRPNLSVFVAMCWPPKVRSDRGSHTYYWSDGVVQFISSFFFFFWRLSSPFDQRHMCYEDKHWQEDRAHEQPHNRQKIDSVQCRSVHCPF
ncbi:hypothetical protein L210DRAFT_69939 [Boletus edulis BED1]|uniref:Uncharacterized protein n=1 Tax=Boletus edulis BED1 TaxID=1328754 RepID=A0AAD4BDW6_BOLED|nr:hypothetical protein L210DRAFT_69939 [Boletus edulis BED1]